MKKILFTAAVLLAALTSCTKENIYYQNDIQTFLIPVASNQWAYTNVNDNNCFIATVDMPEITESVMKTGMIKMYRVYDFGTSKETQVEMPYLLPLERYWEEDNFWEFYTEVVTYEISRGKITIFFTMTNFDYEIDETMSPDAMQFRCVIMQ